LNIVPIDIEGPVLGEVFVLSADASGIRVAGPCGPDAWHVEVAAGQDPTDAVASICRRVVGDPTVVHSTSWRTDKGGVMLTFVAVYEPDRLVAYEGRAVRRTDLARGDADAAPRRIDSDQVLEHGLRHLAWLRDDDDVVRGALSSDWHRELASYSPAPFRALR
jgi:hypothetical protein